MNKVEIQGRIQHIYERPNCTIVTVSVRSDIIRGKRTANYPQIFFRGDKREAVKPMKVGDFVNVKGKYFTSFRVNGSEITYRQIISGTSIEPAMNEMSSKFGVELGGNYENINEVLIVGDVVTVNAKANFTELKLRPDGDKYCISIISFSHNNSILFAKYLPGNKVAIKAEVQTKIIEKDGKRQYMQDLVIRYLDSYKKDGVPVIAEEPTIDDTYVPDEAVLDEVDAALKEASEYVDSMIRNEPVDLQSDQSVEQTITSSNMFKEENIHI